MISIVSSLIFDVHCSSFFTINHSAKMVYYKYKNIDTNCCLIITNIEYQKFKAAISAEDSEDA